MRVLIVGAGRIGLPFATWCNRFHDTEILEKSSLLREQLKEGTCAFFEPDINIENAKIVDEPTGIYDWVFICYGPLNHELDTDNFIESLSEYVDFGKLVIRGAIEPGTSKRISQRYGVDVICAPERLVEGKAVAEELSIPKIIGSVKGQYDEWLYNFFNDMGMKAIIASSSTVAEACKINDNTYRFVQIAYSIELAKICWKLDIDPNELIELCNIDYPRNNLMKTGLGAYGFCLLKDPIVFARYSHRNGMLRGALKINHWPLKRIANIINEKYKTVSVLGLSYKGHPPTDDDRFTPYEFLRDMCPTVNFKTYDPLIECDCKDLEEACTGVEAIIVLTNNPAFKDVKCDEIIDLIDPWGICDAN